MKQSDGKIGSAFIRDAKYLDACVKETLRFLSLSFCLSELISLPLFLCIFIVELYLSHLLALVHALRMTSPVLGSLRRAMEDVQVGQYIIPKGDFVCLSGYFVHYDENIFPEPTKWRPERWLEGKSLPLATFGGSRGSLLFDNYPVRKFAYSQSAAGKHMCLGRLLATAEVKVTVALLLQKYELRLPNGLPPLDFSKSSIVPFVGGCVMEYSPL